MSTLQEVRDRVRTTLDFEADDLPDTTLDQYVREGFDRTFARHQRWPFFEYTWTLTLTSGDTTMPIPSVSGGDTYDVASIESLQEADTETQLVYVPQAYAEAYFAGSGSTNTDPSYYSIWNDVLDLWPTPTAAARTYTLRGYRDPLWSGTAGSELDGDRRLHQAITHYATSLAYSQLEDPELEAMWLARWNQTMEDVRREVKRPRTHQPFILNGGMRVPRRRNKPNVYLTLP